MTKGFNVGTDGSDAAEPRKLPGKKKKYTEEVTRVGIVIPTRILQEEIDPYLVAGGIAEHESRTGLLLKIILDNYKSYIT